MYLQQDNLPHKFYLLEQNDRWAIAQNVLCAHPVSRGTSVNKSLLLYQQHGATVKFWVYKNVNQKSDQ